MEKQLQRAPVFGSYPEVTLSEQPEFVLNRLLEASVIRDASDSFRIKHAGICRHGQRPG
jgi:hypothetical protein